MARSKKFNVNVYQSARISCVDHDIELAFNLIHSLTSRYRFDLVDRELVFSALKSLIILQDDFRHRNEVFDK